MADSNVFGNNASLIGGGGGGSGSDQASDIKVSVGGFNKNLGAGDVNVQRALQSVNDLEISGGGSGLSAVTSDVTLTGTGTSTDALKVAEPYTAGERNKLAGIADNATANTGDITAVTAGTGLTGGGVSGAVTLDVSNPFSATDKTKLDGIAKTPNTVSYTH